MMPVYLNSVIYRSYCVCGKVCVHCVSEGTLYFQSPGSHCVCCCLCGKANFWLFLRVSPTITFEKQVSSSFMSSVLVPHISVLESYHGHSTLTSFLASSGLLRAQF